MKKQLESDNFVLSILSGYEVAFHRYNFLHLTGIKINDFRIKSSIQFYDMCLDSRLSESDFEFTKDGSTVQKLDILEKMMSISKNVQMIGNFTDRGPRLYTEKIAGGVCGCIGFVQDKNTRLNVPNTLIKKDIRDVTASPTQKVYVVFSKAYSEEQYSSITKIDKKIEINNTYFNEDIEMLINRELICECKIENFS